MIASALESLGIRVLLGAALDCADRGDYARIRTHVEGLLAWCSTSGITEAAQLELAEGQSVRVL